MNTLTKQEVIKYTLAFGYSVSVWDGEEWQVKKSQNYQDIMDAIESVDVAEIRVREKDGNVCGWAMIVNGLDADEEVADYSGPFMEYLHRMSPSELAVYKAWGLDKSAEV